MNAPIDRSAEADGAGTPDSRLTPLAGEAGIPNVALASRARVPRKGLFAIALLVLTLLSFSAISIQRLVRGGKAEGSPARLASDRPAASSFDPKRPDMTLAARPAPGASSPVRVPAIVPTAEELADPIGIRRSSSAMPTGPSAAVILPEDAPAVLVASRPGATPTAPRTGTSAVTEGDGSTNPDPLAQTRRNLDGYQRQLQTLLDSLTKPTLPATAPASSGTVPTPPTGASSGGGSGSLLGGQLPISATPRVSATTLVNRSLLLPKGTSFTCALTTRVVSSVSGFVGCQVQRHVYGDDGRVLLIERGSHLDGEYRITSVRPGSVRIPVVWTRVRTPNGVVVDIDSPGTGQLGESGIDGDVDNRWPERIGAALLLSLIDDSLQLAIQHESAGAGSTVVLPSTTSKGSKLAEKVLDSTINIPPLIYRNQGGIVGIYVARDVDFSSVYELQPSAEGSRP